MADSSQKNTDAGDEPSIAPQAETSSVLVLRARCSLSLPPEKVSTAS